MAISFPAVTTVYFPLSGLLLTIILFLFLDIFFFFIIQANLLINPAALLPGAIPILPGAVSVLPGAAPKSSAGMVSSSPDLTPMGAQTGSEQGVSFDAPVQVTTLQSVHKVRPIFLCLCAFRFLAWISSANHLSCRLVPKSLDSGDPSPEQQGNRQQKHLQQMKMLCCQIQDHLV